MTGVGTGTGATATLGGIQGGTIGKLSTSITGQVDLVIDDSDRDEDGPADSREMQYLGNLASTPFADPDIDGQINAIEFLAGTNPASGSFLFAAIIAP